MIKMILVFIWTLIKQLIIYTLSVIPASCTDAIVAARLVRIKNRVGNGSTDVPRKRNRRGHRGGRKHRKRHF